MQRLLLGTVCIRRTPTMQCGVVVAGVMPFLILMVFGGISRKAFIGVTRFGMAGSGSALGQAARGLTLRGGTAPWRHGRWADIWRGVDRRSRMVMPLMPMVAAVMGTLTQHTARQWQ